MENIIFLSKIRREGTTIELLLENISFFKINIYPKNKTSFDKTWKLLTIKNTKLTTLKLFFLSDEEFCFTGPRVAAKRVWSSPWPATSASASPSLTSPTPQWLTPSSRPGLPTSRETLSFSSRTLMQPLCLETLPSQWGESKSWRPVFRDI